MSKAESYETIWDVIADTAGESANMQAKAELMRQIVAIIKKNDCKQVEAAQHCGITQPRLNDLLRGRISRFSLDALVNIAAAIGQRVHIELEAGIYNRHQNVTICRPISDAAADIDFLTQKINQETPDFGSAPGQDHE